MGAFPALDGLALRRRLGRDKWGVPQPFGPDGWLFDSKIEPARIIVTCSDHPDMDVEFVHASISRPEMPTYEDLKMLHAAVWPNGHAYQVFVPESEHVNIHEHALHLWGAVDGRPMLPDFSMGGVTI